MKVVNFWKTLFCSVLAITAFTACSDDDDNGYSGMPEITVNGGEVVTIAGKLAGGKLEQSVEVVSKGDWDLTFKNAGDSQWCTPSAMSGKTGTTTLTFTLGQATAERTAELTLTAYSTFEGIPLKREATIKVVQSDNDVPTGNALYSENCGTDGTLASSKPKVGDYTGWQRGGSLDQAGVTYSGDASVRDIKGSYLPTDDEKDEVSGTPIVYVGSTTQVFNINNINIGTDKNFTFTFTALDQSNYDNGPVFTEVTSGTLKFSVSTDGGQTFAPVVFSTQKVAAGSWYLCTAPFKIPASVSTDKITVRFDSYIFTGSSGEGHQGLRLDDFKLFAGGNGPELDPEEKPDPEKTTIGQITGAGTFELEGVTVVTRSDIAYVIADATGSMMVYGSNEVKVGDKINISGDVTVYNATSVPQFDSKTATVSEVSSGNAWTYNFTDYSVADVQAYLTNIKCIPIALKGTIVKDGNYFNLEIEGADKATLQGSVQYYTPDAANIDVPVVVKGYAVGTSKSGDITRIKIFPHEITVNSTEPYISATAPATFKADGETIEVAFTAGNLGSNKVFAKTEGTDAAQFTLGTVGANSVPVTAKANDGAAKSATLTLYVAASEGAAAVATTSVDLKQAAKSSGSSSYTLIDKAADLAAGTYYMAGYAEEYYNTGSKETTTFAPYSYHMWTGEVNTGDLVTSGYEFTNSQLTINPAATTGEAVEITLTSAGNGAFYIQYNGKYLIANKVKRALAFSDTPTAWTLTNADKGGILAQTTASDGEAIMGTAGAESKMIRAYKTPAASLVYGICFFKAN